MLHDRDVPATRLFDLAIELARVHIEQKQRRRRAVHRSHAGDLAQRHMHEVGGLVGLGPFDRARAS